MRIRILQQKHRGG